MKQKSEKVTLLLQHAVILYISDSVSHLAETTGPKSNQVNCAQ